MTIETTAQPKPDKQSRELVTLGSLPAIPVDWDYNESVAKVRQLIYKWKELTIELANELYVAREALRQWGGDRKSKEYQLNKSSVDNTWTGYCQDIGSSVQVVNRWLRRFILATTKKELSPPKGKSQVVYADPPWDYSNSGLDQSAQQHYQTIPTLELCKPETWLKLPIQEILQDRSVLFLWVTYPFAREGFQVCEAWGFQYKAQMVWVKNGGTGAGWWVEPRHELLYIAARGQELHPAIKPESVFYYERHGHSEKPEEVYTMIEQMYTGPYIELFARQIRPGWGSWGNEINEKDIQTEQQVTP